MKLSESQKIIKYIKENENKEETCYFCGRPTSGDIDEMNKPVCSECYNYITALVNYGEWIEDEYNEKATYADFEKTTLDNWAEYFTLKPEEIPFDKLADEAYYIYKWDGDPKHRYF